MSSALESAIIVLSLCVFGGMIVLVGWVLAGSVAVPTAFHSTVSESAPLPFEGRGAGVAFEPAPAPALAPEREPAAVPSAASASPYERADPSVPAYSAAGPPASTERIASTFVDPPSPDPVRAPRRAGSKAHTVPPGVDAGETRYLDSGQSETSHRRHYYEAARGQRP